MKNKPDRQSLIKLASILVLLLLVFSAYSNTFQSPPLLDDFHSFVDEPKLQIESLSLHNLKGLTQTVFGYYRVLPIASFAWDFYWGKGHISAFHVTNLVIHFICTILMFFLLSSLFRCVRIRHPDDIAADFPVFWLILLLTGLWSLNPVQTNAVTYLVQRMTSMAAMFYLLSFTCYLQARLAQQQGGKRLQTVTFYLASAIAALCAFLSKQNAAMLPVMIVVAEILFFTPDLVQRMLKKKLLFTGIMAIIIVLGFWISINILPHILESYNNRYFTLEERLLTELRIVTSYVGLLILPLPRFLNLEHDVPLSTSIFSPFSTLLSLIFLVFLLVTAWKLRCRRRLITFGICWFFINLAIESTIIALELKFEHRVYLPSIGLYLAMSLIVVELIKPLMAAKKVKIPNRVVIASTFILLSFFSLMTYSRNSCWSDGITLYKDCVQKAPTKARNHSNLSREYILVGDYDQAIAEAESALIHGEKGNEEYWVAASNIISAYNSKGEPEKAISRGEELLQSAPPQAKKNSYPVFLHNLGNVYSEQGDYRSAYNLYTKALAFIGRCNKMTFKSVIEPAVEVDITLLLQRLSGVQNDLTKELNLNPGDATAVDSWMASYYFDLRKYDRALYYCKQGLAKEAASEKCRVLQDKIELMSAANQIQEQKGTLKHKYFYRPFKSRYNFLMATAFIIEKMKMPLNGLLQYCLNEAGNINFTSPDVHLLKSWYFYQQKKYVAALENIDQGIKLDPEFAQLWVNRGIYALAAGQEQVAHSAFQKALLLYPGYPNREKLLVLMKAAADPSEQSSHLSVNQQHNGRSDEQMPQYS